MVYMGSKSKISKYILPIINQKIEEEEIENFYDCFCGGFNIGAYINCENIYAYDLSPTLIELHKQAQSDFSLIPTDSSRENWDRCYSEYKRMKKKNFKGNPEILYMEIGAIGWLGGFSGKGFEGGYGVKNDKRNYFEERYRNLKMQSEEEGYKKAVFIWDNYKNIVFKPHSIGYCDAPYKNTVSYGINKNFNYSEYYKWLMETAKTTPLFISEQELPAEIPAKIVWEQEITTGLGVAPKAKKKISEKLFYLDLR